VESEGRVVDDDESRYVFEGFGPLNRQVPPERRQIQRFMQRVAQDVQEHPEDYGALRDSLILLAENYARTCASHAELARRLDTNAADRSDRAAAAVLLRRLWQAQLAAEQAGQALRLRF
jgi:hypothetical protein